ncbi:MAG: TetR/AcrR family transcriptional regulator [Catenulispora sp.]|nr:TetR/AcrR family transcriptional regulator [Catenulispora sp.]
MAASRAQLREEAILLATMDLLGEVGYERMSIDGVAERARASKATIYRRWPGKAELIGEAVRRFAGQHLSPPDPTGDLRRDLLAVLRTLRTSLEDQDADLILGLLSAMRHDAHLAHIVRQHVVDHKRDAFAAVLEHAASSGVIPARPPAGHALLAEIASAVLISRLLITDDPLDDAFLADLVDGVLLPAVTRHP